MTNNLNTIEGAQQEVIDQLEYNLQAKGVLDAQFNPTTGLLGLINRIPDIEPSTNINLNITLTLTSAEPSVDYGGSILLSATLMASYEGTSDVDLKTGEITGATITFKKGGTIIGTSITDNNGVATLLYTPVAADCDTTLNLSAVFNGTDNFNSANSNNINVDVNSTLELTSDKDILSYTDNEYATLTATLNSADKNNKEVIFEVRKQSDDSLVETLTGNTDSSGIATVYYFGNGVGDLNIKAECMSLIQIFGVQDLLKYDSGASDQTSKYDTTYLTGKAFSHENDAYKITSSSNGYGLLLAKDLSIPRNVVVSLDVKSVNGSGNHHIVNGVGLFDSANNRGVEVDAVKHHSLSQLAINGFTTSSSPTSDEITQTNNLTISSNTWYHIELEVTDTTLTAKIYNGDTLVQTLTTSNNKILTDNNTVGFAYYIVNGTAYFKNLKVKPL